MDVCGESFASWGSAPEPGVFNVNDAGSSERGVQAYRGMGYLDGGANNFKVLIAAREAVQNGLDAGATAVQVALVWLDEECAVLFVSDNAPLSSCFTMDVFNNVYMTSDKSSKPGASAGGKGQARTMYSSLDGMAVFGPHNFAACVGVKYAAAVSDATGLVTYKAATVEQRAKMTAALAAPRPGHTQGSTWAFRIRGLNNRRQVECSLECFLKQCANPAIQELVVCDVKAASFVQDGTWRHTGPLPPLAPPKTMSRQLQGGGKVAFTITPTAADSFFPVNSTKTVVVHVRCRGIIMFTRWATVHDICNADKVQLYIDMSGETDEKGVTLKHADMFTLNRNDLRADRLQLTVDQLAKLAAAEFQGLLHKPTKFLVTAATSGAELLAGVSPRVLARLNVHKLTAPQNQRAADMLRAAADIQALSGRDRLDTATVRSTITTKLPGCSVGVPVMVNDTGKGVFDRSAPPTPDECEVAALRFCGLVTTVCVMQFNAHKGGSKKTAPAVGALYSDDPTLLGMAYSDNIIYINVIDVLEKVYTAPAADMVNVLKTQLNNLVLTTVHEVSHAMVDLNQNHSRTFWDCHVELLNNLAVKDAVAFLLDMACNQSAVQSGISFLPARELLKSMDDKLLGKHVLGTGEPGDPIILDDSDGQEEPALLPSFRRRRKRLWGTECDGCGYKLCTCG